MATAINSARELYNILDSYVVGQEEAKKALSSAIFMHLMRNLRGWNPLSSFGYGRKSNLLLMGPSGCGKTYMMDVIESVIGIPVFRINASEISRMGFAGTCLKDHFESFARQLHGPEDLPIFEHSVIFIDEIDKICIPCTTSTGENHNLALQHSLLKVVEGTEYQIGSATISTKNMLFILAGNFAEVRAKRKDSKKLSIGFGGAPEKAKKTSLQQELVSSGMILELVGRMTNAAEIYQLTKRQLKQALIGVENNIVDDYQDLLEMLGSDFTLNAYYINKIVDQCFTDGTGARGLQSAVDALIRDKFFDLELENQCFYLSTDGDKWDDTDEKK